MVFFLSVLLPVDTFRGGRRLGHGRETAEERRWQREAQDGGAFEGERRDPPGFWWELSLHVSEPHSEGPQLPGSSWEGP